MGGQDKLLAPVAGKPLLVHTLRAFEECTAIEQMIVVLSDANAGAVLALLRPFKKVTKTAPGGARRQDSVRHGLFSLSPCEQVVVHDGARPLVTPGIISHGLVVAQETGAAAAAVPVVDTLKATREDGRVIRTVPREGLWAVQTPQVFRYDILLAAHERVTEDVTDDCAMVERLGYPVYLYEGSRFNIKVTTPEDLRLADALLRAARVRGRTADERR
jgi:2-C-methyl-D-erythritol 4-phosphate cytidylyltransferase